jgi:hypothetical protein
MSQLSEKQENMWNAIKGILVNYYGMDRLVGDICQVFPMPGEDLYLKSDSPAFATILEDAIYKGAFVVTSQKQRAPRFVVEQVKKYFIVKDNPDLE